MTVIDCSRFNYSGQSVTIRKYPPRWPLARCMVTWYFIWPFHCSTCCGSRYWHQWTATSPVTINTDLNWLDTHSLDIGLHPVALSEMLDNWIPTIPAPLKFNKMSVIVCSGFSSLFTGMLLNGWFRTTGHTDSINLRQYFSNVDLPSSKSDRSAICLANGAKIGLAPFCRFCCLHFLFSIRIDLWFMSEHDTSLGRH